MANVDQNELAKFAAIAHEWWDPTGPCQPLHLLNPLRLSFIEQHTNLAGKQILDVGCGGGILTEALAAQGAIVTGIDLAPEVLDAAKAHSTINQLQINYLHRDVETLAEQQPQQFDIVTCMEMLEHVPEPEAVIQACAKLVKPQGYVFFSTLNRTLKAYLLAVIGAEYILNILPRGTHDYTKFIRPSELSAAARSHGLQLKNMTGISYHVFSKTFSLTDDVSVNYLACCQNSD